MANDNETLTTPVGTAVYPHLHAPDTKFDDAGKYKTDVLYTGQAAKQMKSLLRKKLEESREKFVEGEGKADEPASPWKIPTDDEGNETEGILVSFKMTASGVSKKTGKPWTMSPAIYDASGQRVPSGLKIGGGSQIKVAFTPYLYHGFGKYGVSCRLEAVQVIKLETWAEKSAEDFGFDAAEGGFSVSEANENAFAGSDDGGDSDLDDAPDNNDDGEYEEADF